jgi:hypothetical protein
MKYILNHTFKLLILLTILSISACSLFKTEIVNQLDGKWRLASVVVYPKGQGWSVQGLLSSYNSYGLPEGYIQIEIKDTNGKKIVTRQVRYRLLPNMSHRHRHQYGRAVFYTVFDSIPEGAVVTAELITTSLTET